ncbi:cupin domain-containing protein [Oceanobacillus sp. FSL K6-2867]|uniref:cupin domain-containing protein n=1 Tax=Oceanobacillus sp. FSL K6-2867 TaxID=2954748 RepID=UPI0030DAD8AD
MIKITGTAISKTNCKYLNQGPGIQLLKAGSYEPKILTRSIRIFDIPVNSIQMGYFDTYKEEFEITYELLEIQTVIKGKIVARDDKGNRYRAEEGDVLIFTPTTTVIFDVESDGSAIYTAHHPSEVSN